MELRELLLLGLPDGLTLPSLYLLPTLAERSHTLMLEYNLRPTYIHLNLCLYRS